MPPDPMDDSALPSYARMQHSSPMAAPNRLASVSPTTVGQYQDPRLQYAPADPSASVVSQQQYHGNTATEYIHRSPALGFAPPSAGVPGPSRAQSVDPQRMNNGYPYPYASEGSSPEESWQQHGGIPTPVTDRSHMDESPSPTYVESPSLTSSELAYPSNTAIGDDQKITIQVNQSGYMYTASRSTSPPSTPTSTSSTSLSVTPYQFTFPEGTAVQDRPEFNIGRPSFGQSRAPELTLHGGTANIAMTTGGSLNDALRYRVPVRANTMPSATHPFARIDQALGAHGRESDEDDSMSPLSGSRLRGGGSVRRSTISGDHSNPRSSSSPPPPRLSGTLAVIKAQSFGGLRRTRGGKTKKSSEGAAKLSVEALSVRGISVDIPAHKRQKIRSDPGNDAQL